MTIYNRLVIGGTDYTDSLSIDVTRKMGKSNATSKFWIEFRNENGQYDDTFNLNDEVVVYADKDVAATTKIFTGVIEDIKFTGQEQDERMQLKGRDYGAILQDMTIQPVVYKDRDAGEIAKVIIQQNAVGIVTTDNVDTSTGTTIGRISYNHKNIFDALQELADLAGYYFYVDEDKDVHFEVLEGIISGLTFDNTNITKSQVRHNDSEIFNKVWIYGDRILTGATDIGGIGAGSVMTLTDQPHNTRVFVSDVLQEIGGIINMDDPYDTSGLKYVVDFSQKDIVFVSGTAAGDNIPSSGTSNIQVDYERSTPVLKFKQDANSIVDYGPKTKVFTDESIKDFNQASDIATAILEDSKDPKVEVDIWIYGVVDVTPGNTAVVNIPFHNVSNTYTILSADYNFNTKNNLADSVLRLTLGQKIRDFIDVMKDQMLRTQALETGPLEGTMTRLETFIGSVVPEVHWEIQTTNIGSNFVFHSDKHGLIHDPNSRIGYSDAGSTMNASGGDF